MNQLRTYNKYMALLDESEACEREFKEKDYLYHQVGIKGCSYQVFAFHLNRKNKAIKECEVFHQKHELVLDTIQSEQDSLTWDDFGINY